MTRADRSVLCAAVRRHVQELGCVANALGLSCRVLMSRKPTEETKRRTIPECPACGGRLINHGAESRGDGDIYDVLSCAECGATFHWHASYCGCGCGGNRWETVPADDDY